MFFDDFFSKKAICKNDTNGYIQSTSDGFPTCSFTGKEKDEETGYGYFGARYMDHELMAMWLSVDPMANKYPSLSPYNYCAWNPVKLVDPDGRQLWKPEILEDGTINYLAEKGDNAETLQKQYGLSKTEAQKLYGKLSSEGKISGKDVADITDVHSDILKYNNNYKSGNRMHDIQRWVYHAGFACLYNKVKQGGRPFKLNEFFSGLEQRYTGITTRDWLGNRPSSLNVPALGGGDIPILDFSCQVGGDFFVHQDGSYKQRLDFSGFRLLYNEKSPTSTKYEMPAFSFYYPNSSADKFDNSYR